MSTQFAQIDVQKNLQNTKKITTPISSIKIVKERTFEIEGKNFPVEKSAYDDLLKIVGMSNKTVGHINDTITEGAGFAVVKELMKAISHRKGTKVTLLVSTDTASIARIALEGEAEGAHGSVAPAVIQELINFAIEKNPRVHLKDTLVMDAGTKIAFNLMYDKAFPLAMPKEDISLGKQIIWDLLGPTQIGDFAERLICTNGMTGIRPGNFQNLDGTSTSGDWYKTLYDSIINPNAELIKKYEDLVYKAMQTSLSVYEYNQIKAKLMTTWYSDAEKIMGYLGNESWKTTYIQQHNIELDKLSAAQMHNCPTNVNAWDAINAVTDLASHTYKTPVSHRQIKDAQNFAGKLLNKNWDANSWMVATPNFKASKPVNSYKFAVN